jgi:hypothetical protein
MVQICARRLFVYIRLMKERMCSGLWSKGWGVDEIFRALLSNCRKSDLRIPRNETAQPRSQPFLALQPPVTWPFDLGGGSSLARWVVNQEQVGNSNNPSQKSSAAPTPALDSYCRIGINTYMFIRSNYRAYKAYTQRSYLMSICSLSVIWKSFHISYSVYVL